jgi:hypothetical protein
MFSGYQKKTPYIFFAIFVFFLTSCGQSAADDSLLPGTTGTLAQADLLENPEGSLPKPAVVVSLVELSDGQYISNLTLFLNEELYNAEIYINGQNDVAAIEKIASDRKVNIGLFALPLENEITITFKSGEDLLATCKITVAGSVQLNGDCGW